MDNLESRHKTTLDSFVAYCNEHPEQRFWQALRNWSGYHFIFTSDIPAEAQWDTFYLEGRRHDVQS